MDKQQIKLKIQRNKERKLEKVNKRQMEMAFEMLTIIPVYVLHEEFGFGSIRLERFLFKLFKLANDISNDKVELSTLANIVDADTGIKYQEKTRTWVIN